MDPHEDGAKRLGFVTFGITDYFLFFMVLLISVVIGIYFGFYKKQKTTADYLLGGKKMGAIPISISLAASYTSAITLLGMPAEIYAYGTQYVMSCLATFLTSFIIANVFLPVFYELQLSSSFEYLSLRFNDTIRRMISFITLVNFILVTPLVMYAPALAFNLVSGVDIKYITPIICCICMFYTAIGGLKAVVWTDAIQFFIMNGSIFLILILGVPNEGGLSAIWKLGEQSNRIEFINLDFSPYTRMTLWSLIIGMSVTWIAALGVNQMCIQRFLALPTMADAKKVLYIYCVLVVTIKALCLFSGLIMFARYEGCDPYSAGLIKKFDQILPYYVLDTARNMKGLPGVFVAGIFSAALSTMSTLLNTACGVIYNDFLLPLLPSLVSEKNGSAVMKIVAVVIGTVCTLMVFVLDKFGSIVELSISLDGLSCGAILGTFVLGMLVPRGNAKGALSGALSSLLFMAWILYKSKEATDQGYIKYSKKPLSVDKCDFNVTLPNSAIANHSDPDPEEVFFLHRVSFTWFSLMGFVTMLAIAIPVSYMTEPPSSDQTKPVYFSPFIRKYLTKKSSHNGVKIELKPNDREYSKVTTVDCTNVENET